MAVLTGEQTVSEVARSIPSAVRVLERYGIDYCCGGDKPLSQACQEKSVRLEEVLAEVEKARQSPDAAQERDWSSATLTELIDHILNRHHAYLRTEMPRLTQMLGKVIEAHGEKHGESLRPLSKVYGALRKELEQHMWKEENVLFPFIVRVEGSGAAGAPPGFSVGDPIRMMEQEHESAGEALRQMRSLTGGYQAPEDACNTYRALLDGLATLEADLHQHIHLENNILFPRSLAL